MWLAVKKIIDHLTADVGGSQEVKAVIQIL